MHPSLLGEEIQAVDILHTKSFSDGKKKKREKKRDVYLEEIFLFVCHDIFSIFSIFLLHFYRSVFN